MAMENTEKLDEEIEVKESGEEEEKKDAPEEGAKPEEKEKEEKKDRDGDETENKDAKKADKKDSKSKFVKKKPKKNRFEEEILNLTDRLKRQMAEFENFRKRTDKEKSQMYDMGAKSMLERILPVVDSFERGLGGLPEDKEDPFVDGMKMVYKQLMTALSEAGVQEIESVGQTFDPDRHNAVMHIDDDAYGENEIVEELQKGYTFHDTVVRYAMVKVAN